MAQINGYGYADACIEQEPADQSQTNLVVNYLPIDLTQEELSHLFGLVGELKQCRLIMDKTTGKNMGYGFITYVNAEHAKNAIVAYNGYKVHDKNIKVSFACETGTNTNLYIGGLPQHYTQRIGDALQALWKDPQLKAVD
ncbi:RNA recognition motif domain-containing protein [Ditylenchus destructor]|uniref:RNA recognition motif domain-containing protein n=1 Tax=Ditylenchus destructor TaxID=166010 RepID=A0AAD4R378_9BILA|nr:RNA recognition motif domain-containing protein [Ditylenchus destructor]